MAIDPDRLSSLWKSVRDPLTWTLGAALALYEGFVRHGMDQGLLVLVGGLIGLPSVVRYEEKRAGKKDQSDDKDDDS